MVGEDTANELYDLTDKLFKCKSDHVYTMFEWLKSIYEGKNEPSRNEFDLDYNGYLAEQKRMGKLDAAGMQSGLRRQSKKSVKLIIRCSTVK